MALSKGCPLCTNLFIYIIFFCGKSHDPGYIPVYITPTQRLLGRQLSYRSRSSLLTFQKALSNVTLSNRFQICNENESVLKILVHFQIKLVLRLNQANVCLLVLAIADHVNTHLNRSEQNGRPTSSYRCYFKSLDLLFTSLYYTSINRLLWYAKAVLFIIFRESLEKKSVSS